MNMLTYVLRKSLRSKYHPGMGRTETGSSQLDSKPKKEIIMRDLLFRIGSCVVSH